MIYFLNFCPKIDQLQNTFIPSIYFLFLAYILTLEEILRVTAKRTLPNRYYQALAINRPVKNMNGREQRGAWLGALVVDRKRLRRWRFLWGGKKKEESSKVGPFSRESDYFEEGSGNLALGSS